MDLATAIQEYTETVSWTRHPLMAFRTYCQVEDTWALKPEDVVGFCRYLAGRGLALKTRKVYQAAVNTFFRWLSKGDMATFNAGALEEALAEQSRIIPSLHEKKLEGPQESEVRQLIEAAYAAVPEVSPDTPLGRLARLTYLRNIAIVEALRTTGARPAELVALRLGDLELENQVARAPDGRMLYFDLASWGALMHYLLARSDPMDRPLFRQQLPVFAGHHTASVRRGLRPLNTRMPSEIVRGLRASGTITPRKLRIRFGQSLLAATADERGTARLLGVKDVVSVRRYGKGS